jgi:DNA-binding MarR family transcriptional regulator
MAAERGDQLSRIGPLLRQAQRHSNKAFVAALEPLGIQGRHFGVLFQLDAHGPLSQRRLMDLTGEDRTAMVRTVDDLERLGLAERRPDPTDRRAHAVQITDAGRKKRAEAAVVAAQVAERLFEGSADDESETLISLLQRFVDRLDRADGAGADGADRAG